MNATVTRAASSAPGRAKKQIPISLFDCFLVGRLRPVHEFAELNVNPHHVGPKLLHLPEILLNRRPLRAPVIFQQAEIVIAVIVESPGYGSPAGTCAHEAALVSCNGDPVQSGGALPLPAINGSGQRLARSQMKKRRSRVCPIPFGAYWNSPPPSTRPSAHCSTGCEWNARRRKKEEFRRQRRRSFLQCSPTGTGG
jgi:hypothetical protein